MAEGKGHSIKTAGWRGRFRPLPRRFLWPIGAWAILAASTGGAAAISTLGDGAAGYRPASGCMSTQYPIDPSCMLPSNGRPRPQLRPSITTAAAAVAEPSPADDLELKRRELEIKARELDVREREAEKEIAAERAPWWRRGLDPLVLAIMAAALTMIGNMIVAFINNRANLRQEVIRSTNALTQEKQKAEAALELEIQKARYTLVLQAIGTGDPVTADQNIKFFIDAGLLDRQGNSEFTPRSGEIQAGAAVPRRPLAAKTSRGIRDRKYLQFPSPT